MKITINIDERTGNAIREFCKANNLKQNQYLVDIIEKQFNIDRFGDLNEMIKTPEKPKKVPMKIVEPVETAQKKELLKEEVPIQKTPIIVKPVKRTLKSK